MTDADPDARSLGQVMAEADWRLAEGFAEATGSDPEIWFLALQRGVPFAEVKRRARTLVSQRVRAFQDRKK